MLPNLPSFRNPLWLAAAFGLTVFAGATLAVVTGHADLFDLEVLDILREEGRPPENLLGPMWLYVLAVFVTALGSTKLLCLSASVIAAVLAFVRRWRDALLLLAGVVGATGLNTGLKLVFDRDRPDIVFRAVEAHNDSFPSGHAMASTAAFLTAALLVARYTPSRPMKMCAFAVAAVAAVLIGLTRIYLGVHWTSDVVAGWGAGAAWAMICALASPPTQATAAARR